MIGHGKKKRKEKKKIKKKKKKKKKEKKKKRHYASSHPISCLFSMGMRRNRKEARKPKEKGIGITSADGAASRRSPDF